MTKVYISGQITGRPTEEVRKHFYGMQFKLEQDGFITHNPLQMPERDSWEEYMKDSLSWLVDCDCIMMLEGWQHSRGAILERQVAWELGLELWYEEATQ